MHFGVLIVLHFAKVSTKVVEVVAADFFSCMQFKLRRALYFILFTTLKIIAICCKFSYTKFGAAQNIAHVCLTVSLSHIHILTVCHLLWGEGLVNVPIHTHTHISIG